jgi:hypothetical protein
MGSKGFSKKGTPVRASSGVKPQEVVVKNTAGS